MALPTKQGLRKIQVEQTQHYWKLVTTEDGYLAISIGVVEKPNCRLLVVTPWLEPWLAMGSHPAIGNSETGIITPALVSQAIKFALFNNWTDSSHQNMSLEYRNQVFSVKSY